MKIIDRHQLIENVYKRFNGTLSKLILYDALQAICEDLENKIADGQSVSINNFGIFHKYEFGSRQTIDINSGKLRSTKSFINVRFVPNKVFSDLINKKKLFFKGMVKL